MAGASLLEYLNLVRRHKLVFLSVLVGFVVLVMAVTLTMEPVYQSTTTLIVEPADQARRISLIPTPSLPNSAVEINNDVEVLRSYRLMTQVVERLERAGPIEQFDRIRSRGGDPAEWLRKSIAVRQIKSTYIIELTAEACAPEEATRIANTIAAVYMDASQRESRAKVSRVKEFLDEQVRLARDRLAVTEVTLKDFQETERVTSIDEETEALIDQMAKAEGLLRAAEVELSGRQERLERLTANRDQVAGSLRNMIDRVDAPLIAALRTELAEVMAYYAKLQAEGYAPEHEKLRVLMQKASMLKRRLAEEALAVASAERVAQDPVAKIDVLSEQIIAEGIEIQALAAQARALSGVVAGYQRRLEHLPAKAHRLAQLRRAAKVEETILVMLQQRFEEARIDEAGDAGRCRGIDPARVPRRPVRPRPLLTLMLALVLGSGLAYGACALTKPLERHIVSPEAAQQLTGLRILGQIPLIQDGPLPEKSRRRLIQRLLGATVERERTSALVSAHSHGSRVVEAYRSLRTVLQYAERDQSPAVILVTSSGSFDGKTTTAANLAITFAAGGERVLLIDADMRKPRVHDLFGLKLEPGLREVLTGEMPLESAVHRSTVAHLDILPAGGNVQNPTELLASHATIDLIEEARRSYNHVIVDSPPVLPVTDPAILSTRVDATVFVVRDRYTPKAALEYAVNVLRCLPIRLAGIIYNEDHEMDRADSYRQGYYRYYSARNPGDSAHGSWITDHRRVKRDARRETRRLAA